jgi:integrase
VLVKLSYEEAYKLMREFVLWRVREKGVSAKRVRTQWFALVSFFRFHNIKGDYSFPSKSIPLTIKFLDKIPTREEFAKILAAPKASLSTRIAIHFMAFAGLRPEDLVKLTYASIKTDFEKGVTPCAVYVPQSKSGNMYVTFIPAETCELLKQYFEERRGRGEKITENSPIIADDKLGRDKPVSRVNLCKRILRAMRSSGVQLVERYPDGKTRKMRPYSLRKYFRSNLTGHMPTEYIEAMMGHLSGLEHVYGGTRDLAPATIERMREAYRNAEAYLKPWGETVSKEEVELATIKTMVESGTLDLSKPNVRQYLIKKLGLEDVEVKVAKMKEKGLDETEAYTKTICEKLGIEPMSLDVSQTNNHDPKKIISEEELENHLAEGWDVQTILPSGKILIRKPC